MMLALQCDKRKQPSHIPYRLMLDSEILALRPGQHAEIILNNGRVASVKINGAIKRWKTRPAEFEIPIKYGMYECARLSAAEAKSRFVVPV